MGNSSSREPRGPDSPSSSQRHLDSAGGTSGPASPTGRNHSNPYDSRSGRGSRHDLSFLGLGSSSNAPLERKETKQERDARKLEKERVTRAKERERSLRDEHIDGGYLVTMGVYTGTEDFSKSIVRQLMIERRIAPFWRGLDDFKAEWTEHQLVAAGRGLPIPAADEIPPELTKAMSSESPNASASNIQSLMVPITSRSQSAGSDASGPSQAALSSPTSPIASSPPSSSPFRPRSKTLASLTTSSKTPSATEMTPREIQLPRDPFVNGQQIEVFLYKDALECPICFLYYPPYLNKTRCCDQAICSECFVQIKRPDPHPPEHEQNDPLNPAPVASASDSTTEPESLVSEPAACPYCQQANFGVTYDPPPFRRGLSYANTAPGLNNIASAMSSSSSLASAGPPVHSYNSHKRRTTSISADAAAVITTDRIRPDWATKLATARSHLARRSAAATALHTAAYLMGNGNNESRSLGFSSRRAFGRNRGGDNAAGSSSSQNENPGQDASDQSAGSGSRRSRMDDLDAMMMAEAIRLSLAAEETRKLKAEKEAAKEAVKEAKKKAKEDRKKEKKERKIYGSGGSSASGSTLSLSLGLGRRRGNSGASNLGREVTVEGNEEPLDRKGKGVNRGVSNAATTAPMDVTRVESSGSSGIPGARHLDTNTLASITDLHQPSPSPTAPDKPSHLRQMSNASSPASSFVDSNPGSLRNDFHGHGSSSTIDSPNASGTNVAGPSTATPDGDEDGGAGTEPMLNFTSLAAMISSEEHSDENKNSSNHVEHVEHGQSSSEKTEEKSNTGLESSIATLKVDSSVNTNNGSEQGRQTTLLESQNTTPEVMVTPETPAALDHEEDGGKQLGSGWSEEVAARQVTQ
ncbi:Protein sip5 [Lachnellula suecica]|uniref:Protein sip5 n=1 Tax=Lachnellula suecica TaxID=602035 RepID=A0A8T9CQU9_9HELO|nr:Protein sip5 [Lachnellula suecica]